MGLENTEQLLDTLRTEYVAAVPETLAKLELQVIEWPAGQGVSTDLLRGVHSLKGTAGTYGLGFVTSACHHLEDFLSKGEPDIDHQAYLSIVLRYIDLIRDYVAAVRAGSDPAEAEFLPRLDALLDDGNARPLRILVVEPARNMSRVVRRALSAEGVSTSTSRSGYEALGRLARENYDAVLTSYETQDISGLSLAKAVRAIDEIPSSLKVILVTSNEMSDAVEAVDRVVRKDRNLEKSLLEALTLEGLSVAGPHSD